MSRSKPKPKTPDEIAAKRYREQQERMSRATFGLASEQLHAAHVLDGDALGLLLTIAEQHDGLRVGAMGNGLAHLVGQGFIEIKNGGACEFGADMRGAGRNGTTAKLTMTGYRALLLRVARRMRGLDSA